MHWLKLKTSVEERRVAGMVTLVTALIAVTPLCGLLFQCGCDWPWLGLDAACNYFKPDSVHRCPWCASLSSGILSTGLAIVSGVWVSLTMSTFVRWPANAIVVRVAIGLSVFVLMALSAAALAALTQAYPLGIGRFLR